MDLHGNDLQYGSTTPKPTTFVTDVISPLSLTPGEWIAIAARVSHPVQVERGNLDEQVQNIASHVIAHQAHVGLIIRHVGFGTSFEWFADHVQKLKERGINKVIWETPNRVTRSSLYHTKYNPHVQAGPREWQIVNTIKENLTFMTVAPPTFSASEEMGYHRRRGVFFKRRKDILSRSERKAILLPRVIQLHRHGHSACEITKMVVEDMGIVVHRCTVNEWIREA